MGAHETAFNFEKFLFKDYEKYCMSDKIVRKTMDKVVRYAELLSDGNKQAFRRHIQRVAESLKTKFEKNEILLRPNYRTDFEKDKISECIRDFEMQSNEYAVKKYGELDKHSEVSKISELELGDFKIALLMCNVHLWKKNSKSRMTHYQYSTEMVVAYNKSTGRILYKSDIARDGSDAKFDDINAELDLNKGCILLNMRRFGKNDKTARIDLT